MSSRFFDGVSKENRSEAGQALIVGGAWMNKIKLYVLKYGKFFF